MNRAAKVVVSRVPPPLDAWSNSIALEGDLVEGVAKLAVDGPVIVVGSTSIVHQLAAADAVDEYRLITIPTVVGTGARLFAEPTSLQLVSVEPMDGLNATLTRYEGAAAATDARAPK
jgi:dihydrofolate reductase